MTYALILLVVLITTPFILSIASKQDKKSKTKAKTIFLSILLMQLILGFFNWEKLNAFGRSGYDLSLAYPASFLALFFIISALQILALLAYKSFNTLVVVLNFINTVLVFVALIRLSSILGFQAVSFASLLAVFAVLLGNVTGLVWINKDRNLFEKYFV